MIGARFQKLIHLFRRRMPVKIIFQHDNRVQILTGSSKGVVQVCISEHVGADGIAFRYYKTDSDSGIRVGRGARTAS